MKALTYHGAKDVRVETVPDPRLVEPDDIVLRVTATANLRLRPAHLSREDPDDGERRHPRP